MKYALIALALSTSAMAFAQSPAPAAVKPTAEAQAAPAVPKPPAASPVLSELESAQVENLELKMQLLGEEEASLPSRRMEINRQYSTLIQKILGEHPGYAWNPSTHALMPAQPAPAKPATPARKDEAPKK